MKRTLVQGLARLLAPAAAPRHPSPAGDWSRRVSPRALWIGGGSVYLGVIGLIFAQAAQAQGAAQSAAPAAAPASAPAAAPAAAPAKVDPALVEQVSTPTGREAFVKQYCVACHSARLKTGGLVLEGVSGADPASNADLWEKVVRRVGAGEMPPPRARRPDAKAAHAFVAALVTDLDAATAKTPFAGPSVVRRLNRTEYGNAVRDLLAIDFPFNSELPADGIAAGFDNIGDALSMSPLLLETYLRVGRKVSELAVGVSDPTPVIDQFPATKSQSSWIGEGAPFETRGGVVARKFFPHEGEYELRAILNDENLTPLEGVRLFRTRVRVSPGLHTFVATFPNEYAEREGPVPNLSGPGGLPLGGPLDVKGSAVRPTLTFLLDGKQVKDFEVGGPNSGEAAFGTKSGPPTVVRAEISGPYNASPVTQSASRDRVFVCRPEKPSQEAACADRILRTLARRAFRRDVTKADMEPILATYARTREKRDFDASVAAAMRDVLVSPNFLFRLEFDPKNAKPGQVHRVADFELASRLSFFLWSSIPDDRLLEAAKTGKLRKPALLQAEVRRMLADRKADALVDNFAAQWLALRDVAEAQPDPMAYPEFDEGLRDAFLQETRLFLRSVMRENRSIVDVVAGDYTYLNERLAGVYGVDGVKGPAFRRVQLAENSPRGGILGQGSVLMVTSHTNKTSPVLRGKWILDNLLNNPPPPPPAGVPPLDESPVEGRKLTTRQQVERHRASPVCSSCHSRMDPFGFALENYDVIGRWRTKDEGGDIDPSGQMANGETFSGPLGLRKTLLAHSDEFVGATVARMMTYALGRPVEGRDQPAVRKIVEESKPNGYRFQDLVLGIVNSVQFQMKQASDQS